MNLNLNKLMTHINYNKYNTIHKSDLLFHVVKHEIMEKLINK